METRARLLLDRYPNSGFAWKVLGVSLLNQGKDALNALRKAATLLPDDAAAHSNLGIALGSLGQLGEAVASYRRALEIKPDHAEAHCNLGNALQALGQLEEVATCYRRALEIKPNLVEAHYNLGTILIALGEFDDAVACFRRALEIKPDYAEALNNLGIALKALGQFDGAIDCYGRALEINPGHAEVHRNLGNALKDLGQLENAVQSYRRAVAIKPDVVEAHCNLAIALKALGQLEDALSSYGRAMDLKPDHEFLYGDWLHTKMKVCDWNNVDDHFSRLFEKIDRNEKASSPFPILAISSSLPLQKKVAQIYVRARLSPSRELPEIAKRPRRKKIQIGYFSADFHDHATAYLIAELLERHDRSRFELTAFSFGPNRDDGMRRRISASFDDFIDVRNKSDRDVATLSRNLEIDIAVDLKGFTQDSRPGIFSVRAAPVQASYLGYPGTMGAEFIDYLIADPTLVAASHENDYSEKIAYLPNSYQVNDAKRLISERVFTRIELGLPRTGFVYCCFNNNYKITPDIFGSWMRILKQVQGSVLWLFEDNALAAKNLRREAELRGVGAERLIFAKQMALPEHLARHRHADLFLDTLPYNAHTTASDALWAGLPVLTRLGDTFAGRVAASLLTAIGLPELITSTPEAYEALAIELAANPDKLTTIKRKLADNRLTTPLFDTRLFARHIEAAYTAMYERYQSDLPPEHIHVAL
jgi:predicted O-linked N-acetylglucosamine transferase (SPINDLY family)